MCIKKHPAGVTLRGVSWKSAGNDLLSPWTDYHRPQVLNGRVRNGNGCDHLGMITGKSPEYQCNLGSTKSDESRRDERENEQCGQTFDC